MNSKAVLISGGTSGIGLATAEILLRRGWRVAVNGRDIVRGEAALAYLAAQERAVFIRGDVATAEGCDDIVAQTLHCFGRLDGLVTSAGYYAEGILPHVSEEDAQRIFAVNVYGTIFLCKAALPYLKRQAALSLPFPVMPPYRGILPVLSTPLRREPLRLFPDLSPLKRLSTACV